MFKDKIFIGSFAGIAGTLAKDLPNLILYRLNIVRYLYAHLAASVHVSPKWCFSSLGYIIGFISDLITGGAIGMVVLTFLDHYGMDHLWYKGIIIGGTIWLFGLGVSLNFGMTRIIPNDPIFNLMALFDHILFGLVTVYLIKRWKKPKRYLD